MTLEAPVNLVLDAQAQAHLGNNGLLHWWLHNVSGHEVTEAALDITLVGGTTDFVFKPSSRCDVPFVDGGVRCLTTPFKATAPGTYGLQVALQLRLGNGSQGRYESTGQLVLTVPDPDASGRVNVTFSRPTLIKGYLPPGSYRVDAPVLFKPGDPATGEAFSRAVGLTSDIPPAERCLSVPLAKKEVPGLGYKVSLEEFAAHWCIIGRHALDGLQFIDKSGRARQGSTQRGDLYRLTLRSYRGGYVTLLTQGTSGRFFQLSPHLHWGQEVVEPGGELVFPVTMLRNFGDRSDGQPNPALQVAADKFAFQGIGTESALAIVTKEQLATPRRIFVANGQAPAEFTQEEVRAVLVAALDRPEAELKFIKLEVLSP